MYILLVNIFYGVKKCSKNVFHPIFMRNQCKLSNDTWMHARTWINMEIQQEIYKRNKILNKYSKRKNKNSSESIQLFKEYKTIRNKITSMKRNSKDEYYNKQQK